MCSLGCFDSYHVTSCHRMPANPGNSQNKAYPAGIAYEEAQTLGPLWDLAVGERKLEAGKREVVACCLNKETCSEDSGSEQCVPRVKLSDRKPPHLCRLKETVAGFLKILSKSVAMGFN